LWSGHPEAIQIAEHQSVEKISDHSVTDRKLDQVSKPECSLQPLTTMPQPEIQRANYIFMTALVDSGYISGKKFPFNNFRASDLHFTSQAFGPEPNALPQLRNCLIQKNFGSPGRIRTSNISVNSLVPDLITIVPEPRQIDGNQQVLAKWA
jgi:hypothetical protein